MALLGPSGSGKTTLLRCLVGLERFDAGEVEVAGIVVCAQDGENDYQDRLRSIRQRCGLVFQQYHLFPHMNVLQNLALAPVHARGMRREEAERMGMELLEQVGLGVKATQRPGKLSGGEQQRVAIARALAMRPDCLLYDEPTSALDAERAQEIWSIMRVLSGQGYTQLIVTHQEKLAETLQCRILRMSQGRVITG